jgi:hypothetical protein
MTIKFLFQILYGNDPCQKHRNTKNNNMNEKSTDKSCYLLVKKRLMSEIHIFDGYPQDGYTQEN